MPADHTTVTADRSAPVTGDADRSGPAAGTGTGSGIQWHEYSVADLGRALRAGRLTARTLAEYTLDRIAAIDPQVHSFIRVTPERALADADRADAELAAGHDRGPLHGIPYGLKDIIATDGIPTTCNSRLLLENVPAEDAAAEALLRAGGGVLVGKLGTAEFALGGPGFDLPFPPARNPWNVAHFTGGSSAGSAAAVAAGLVRVALGSDTGGSIRSPAFNCGVVGLKPTYGLVSRRGLYPLSYSLDHCGPLSWSVEDTALTMNVIAGYDPRDPSSVRTDPQDYTADLGRGVEGLRVGYARELFASLRGISPEVVASVDAAAATLTRLGAIVTEVRLPDFDLFKACARIIMLAEAYAIHEETLRTRPRDYGRYTYQRIAPAATLTGADYVQALRVRRELTVALDRVLADHDVLLTNTGLAPAAPFEDFPEDWPPPAHAVSVQTPTFNVTGHPALSLPVGFSTLGLPLAVQIVGHAFAERTVFRVAAALEDAAGVLDVRPALAPVTPGAEEEDR
ncbi:amidase [Micromonospora cathayae]|uniref:Amidase n=1 Tax=Micromonospora cathayae TaxID=3028804 RepID=A0ABY7ZS81_9ACTN|nr:amidase [Micromonospora sp. HUAS 3]WDZ85847.1 amidase [Micromonospora sp. HUAS 3]